MLERVVRFSSLCSSERAGQRAGARRQSRAQVGRAVILDVIFC
jgi:hypothetical protein